MNKIKTFMFNFKFKKILVMNQWQIDFKILRNLSLN
jgi:hypothetical protein